MVKLDLRGSLREQITRLNSVANPTPPQSLPPVFQSRSRWHGFGPRTCVPASRKLAGLVTRSLPDPNFGLPVAGFVVRDSGVEDRFYSMRKREAENIASCRERDVLDAIDHVTHR